ncbi:MAG: GNAT family N-acetyltransferase [Candidatus Tumulicola sp.]
MRVLTIDDWAIFRELRLEALREAPYAFGSTFNDWQGDGDTEQRWRQRLTDVPFNVIAYLDEMPAGMVSATNPNPEGAVELISMWVAPPARSKRVADALVDAVLSWAHEQGIHKVSLDVVESNERAIAFYRRLGFVDQGRIEGKPGARQERRMLRVDVP